MRYTIIFSVAGLEKTEYRAARKIASQTNKPVAIRFKCDPYDRIKIVEPSGKIRNPKICEYNQNYGFGNQTKQEGIR